MILENFWRIGECVIEYHQWRSHTVTAEQRLERKHLKHQILTDNTGPAAHKNSTLTKFQRAILQYPNAPDQDTKLSPAMILLKRPISDVQMAKF